METVGRFSFVPKRGIPDARDASSSVPASSQAPSRRRFYFLAGRRVRLAAWLTLLLAALSAVVLTVEGMSATSAAATTCRGYVFEAENAIFLETDDGNIYVLKGADFSKYFDKYVEAAGEVRVNEHGENVLTVKSIKAMKPPAGGPMEDQPAQGGQ